MLCALDTNVLVHLVNPQSEQHGITGEVLTYLRRLDVELVLLAQFLVEFWGVTTRPAAVSGMGLTTDEAAVHVRLLRRSFLLLPESDSVYLEWERLVEVHRVRGKQVHDARIAASLTVAGVTHLLTWNPKDFKRFDALNALTPDDVLAGAL